MSFLGFNERGRPPRLIVVSESIPEGTRARCLWCSAGFATRGSTRASPGFGVVGHEKVVLLGMDFFVLTMEGLRPARHIQSRRSTHGGIHHRSSRFGAGLVCRRS